MIQLGIERCLEQPPEILRGKRLGVLMNQASVDASYRYTCDLLEQRFPKQVRAIFMPQHGLWGEQQANMIESPHGHYAPLDVPVFSLYSETRQPTDSMLDEIDCLVVDLQDVGTRVYTFIWTIVNCLEACAARKRSVVILDRPNPIGGEIFEGPILEAGFESFVGGAPIPMRHGLTLGELALLLNAEKKSGADLHVVPMRGWQRSMPFHETGRSWVLPSPNMPRVETTLLYPGQVLLEGTNLSEGRGTTIPFEVVGAPYVDPFALCDELNRAALPGLQVRPIWFVPTFDKWRGQRCGGVALHIVDPRAVRSFQMTLTILAAIRRLWPDDFQWLPPPYEYEREKMPIDILYGSSQLRLAIENGDMKPERIEQLSVCNEAEWRRRIGAYLLYE